jgi:hypothetical protein
MRKNKGTLSLIPLLGSGVAGQGFMGALNTRLFLSFL